MIFSGRPELKVRTLIAAAALTLLVPVGSWIAGGRLSAPAPATVGNCPADLVCERAEIASESGSRLRGWFAEGEPGKPTVVLLHGLRSNRTALVDRFRLFRSRGLSVVAFDFTGSGESSGDRLTFGHLERFDAEAAVRFARERRPGEKVVVIGISMGGAAFLLSEKMPPVDALVLELVYPTLGKAIENRLENWLFRGAGFLSPLLTLQLPVRIGAGVDEMRPVDRIGSLRIPVLVIGGGSDPFTPAEESKQLFDAANEPKRLWIVDGVGHEDIQKARPGEYGERVLEFLGR